MQIPRKIKKTSKRVKRKEAELAVFKLIINNQGQFITEHSLYPKDKVHLHFKKQNSGIVSAMLREAKVKFEDMHILLEKIARYLA
mgnify:FL=1|jgi:hypothetical protein|tara:strand:- start:158 stop:412 length:255 start_codon:yes stop_codon:yes gene_type:complete